MLKERDAVVRKAMIAFDAIVVSVAFFLAYFLRQHFHVFYKLDLFPSSQVVSETGTSLSAYLVIFFLIVPFWCLLLYLNGMYRSLRTKKILEILWIVIKSTFFGTLFFGAIVFLFKLEFVSRLFFALFLILGFVFILLEKITLFSFMHYFRKRGYNYRSLLIVGTGRRASFFIEKIKNHPEWGFRIVGVIDDEPGRGINGVNGIEVIGALKDLSDILHNHVVDEVVFVVPRLRLNHIEEAILTCELEGIKATIAVDLFDAKIAKSFAKEIDGVPLVTFETTAAKEWQLFIKRVMDIIVSGLSIAILSPLFFAVAVVIKLTSRGTVLFRQERLGLNGRRFILYKFRTMYENAQAQLANIDVVKDSDDPSFRKKKLKYITPVGRILRKFSIDELPQLFNVFVGHMSLIGPRPTVPEEVSQYMPWQRRRLSMRPGITCLWQVNGRNKLSFNQWMKLDLEYLDNWSLWLDFKIFVKTIPVVLFGIGAY